VSHEGAVRAIRDSS